MTNAIVPFATDRYQRRYWSMLRGVTVSDYNELYDYYETFQASLLEELDDSIQLSLRFRLEVWIRANGY